MQHTFCRADFDISTETHRENSELMALMLVYLNDDFQRSLVVCADLVESYDKGRLLTEEEFDGSDFKEARDLLLDINLEYFTYHQIRKSFNYAFNKAIHKQEIKRLLDQLVEWEWLHKDANTKKYTVPYLHIKNSACLLHLRFDKEVQEFFNQEPDNDD